MVALLDGRFSAATRGGEEGLEPAARAGRRWKRVPVCLLPVLLSVSLCLAALGALSEVGLFFESGYRGALQMHIENYKWKFTGDACYVGAGGNLVVDPELGADYMKAQVLRTDQTGPLLCAWLDNLFRQHQMRRVAWAKAHQAAKGRVSMLNVVEKLKSTVTRFPPFRVIVTSRYLDLWHDNRLGNAMPWMMATFKYVAPKNGYGLFSELESVFSADPMSYSSTDVFLLLAPAANFHTAVQQQSASKRTVLSGIIGGIGAGGKVAKLSTHLERGDLVDIANLLYAIAKGVFVINASLNDFWLDGATCYFRSRFRVRSVINGLSLCQFLAGQAANDPYGAFRAHMMQSVKLTVTGIDFFNGEAPALSYVVTEGVIFADTNIPGTLVLDNDPQIVPLYIRTTRMARKVRIAKVAFDVLVFLKRIAATLANEEAKQN
ncbi:dense granule protein GRA12 [Besnoitia besnoiti]|uniref:Dense granule protein GRA12 n=1 Tax=Besnoitia besnoiti TaxID=94643 RepID=A0A2A9LZC1_BESBE|nr:dense granule protein GRA12 [Besnoitia besnoiti]PFH31125.1 dense granule protein GRA12 [Besnoitia besnoiti]